MILQGGTKLGPYEILTLLGAGGMGEVWKARDTRLGRLVAIKAIQSAFSDRFEREARSIAALNHPHICSLYDVGPDYLVMELVEGAPLQSPVPLQEALVLADQILDALDAAHRQGVVHRDLKPENILVTKSGVKVLDFGLARFEHPDGAAERSTLATQVVSPTAGYSMSGTLPYMSPEQIEGHEADARSDIFAFGVLLYELLAGRRPFSGKTQAGLMASILKEDSPPLDELLPALTPGVVAVVRTCLEKDPEKRWQSAREVRHALKWIASETASPPMAPSVSVRGWRGIAVLMTLIALGTGIWMMWPASPDPVSRLEASVPDDITSIDSISISPDGRRLVSGAGEDGLWMRDLSAHEWQRVPGTEGARTAFWSPGGRYLGFIVGRQLKKLDMTGGPPETVATLASTGIASASWSPKGDIVLGSWGGGSGGPLWKVSAAGAATALTQVDVSRGEFYHTWPTFLPDGATFLYFRSGPPDVAGMYAGSLDDLPAQQAQQRIFPSTVPAVYANGHLFFLRGNTLMAQPFDARRLRVEREAVPVADNVEISWFSTGVFAVSGSGALAYRPSSTIGAHQLTWFDRQGKALGTVGSQSKDESVALSPDGRRAVMKDSRYGESGDLWTLDLESGARTRLTLDRKAYSPGVWSPDGTLIAFAGGDSGDTLYAKAASGLGGARELLKEPGLRHYATSWSRDGRYLLYHTENAPDSGYDLWALSIDDGQPHLLLGEGFNEWAGTFSPDMQWVAYSSMEGGGSEIYVRPFLAAPNARPAVGERKWQISEQGGNWALWRHDQEIAFNDFPTERAAFAVPVETSHGDLKRGVPRRLESLWINSVRADSTADGQRFLIAVPQVEGQGQPSIRVVLNWPGLFAR